MFMNHRHRMSTFINSSTSNQTAKHPSCNTVGHLRCSMNEAKENSWTPDPSEPRIRYVANCCVCKNPPKLPETPWDTPGKHETPHDEIVGQGQGLSGFHRLNRFIVSHCFAVLRCEFWPWPQIRWTRRCRTELLWFAEVDRGLKKSVLRRLRMKLGFKQCKTVEHQNKVEVQ